MIIFGTFMLVLGMVAIIYSVAWELDSVWIKLRDRIFGRLWNPCVDDKAMSQCICDKCILRMREWEEDAWEREYGPIPCPPPPYSKVPLQFFGPP